MPEPLLAPDEPSPVTVVRPNGTSPLFLTCDHAGRRIPRRLGSLGLGEADLQRHIAWDIGIHAVARQVSEALDATLIAQVYSRLVIDCNRPLAAVSSIPTISEATEIPGNLRLSEAERQARIDEIFTPYHAAIAAAIDARAGHPTLLIAMHSFTPVYLGESRPWHIGTLYGRDRRLALIVHDLLRRERGLAVGDNQPYKASDTTDYAIPVHGERRGLPHVGIEIRQDLIADSAGEAEWAERLTRLLPPAADALPQASRPCLTPHESRFMTNEDIIRHFEKEPDGAWLCVEATVIETPEGPLAIPPGARFSFGETRQGLDVAEYLERLGAQFGS